MSKSKSSKLVPILMAACVVIGIAIGSYYSKKTNTDFGFSNTPTSKLNTLLKLVDNEYVDTVNMNQLVEKAMPQILAELDPHSTYIPAKDLKEVNSHLEGSFSGIGIQFTINKDTIHINSIIKGGPAEKVGLMPGDRIVTVDDSLFVGDKVDNYKAIKTLKGPEGSEVKLGIKRLGEDKLIDFVVTRGIIPQNSIDAAYMINDSIGYIKISKFARTTHLEVLASLAEFKMHNYKGLIIDVRGNSGGYMQAAINIANEFLPKGKLIVYAKGKHFPKIEEFADGTGSCINIPLVALIDEGSASASEILTGAIQDNDRGLIIGRRSFGKGLVQQPIPFNDGSAMRLTVARYYTPSGRCIQRPYTDGNDTNYQMDLYNRYAHGEFFNKDSIKQNMDEVYFTTIGRTVYGGGGVMPDLFVPQDTIGATSYLSKVLNRNLNIQFSFEYVDYNRTKLSKYTTTEDLLKYLKTQGLVYKFVNYAEKKGVKRRNILIYKSKKLLEDNIYGSIIYNLLGMESYLKYFNEDDKTVLKAIEVLKEGKAYPILTKKDSANLELQYEKQERPKKINKE